MATFSSAVSLLILAQDVLMTLSHLLLCTSKRELCATVPLFSSLESK
jgi:hypothetical protein